MAAVAAVAAVAAAAAAGIPHFFEKGCISIKFG
jgi:hypothetical protein